MDAKTAAATVAEVQALVEALAPFALVAVFDIGDDEADTDWFRQSSFMRHNKAPRITVGDLRRARTVLAAFQPGGEDHETLAQRQAHEVMNPSFGSAKASGDTQSYGATAAPRREIAS